MFKSKSRLGFTLMEIIVVMIILGIVASIAVPNVFSHIARSKSQEAIVNLSSIKQNIDACIFANGGKADPCSPGAEGIPAFIATANFVYSIPVAGESDGSIVLQAQSGGNQSSDKVLLTRGTTAQGGKWTCEGKGLYSGVCK